MTLRLCLHEIGSVWNRYEIRTDKPCAYTGPGRIVSPIRYQMGSLVKVTQLGTVLFQLGDQWGKFQDSVVAKGFLCSAS